jgi:hypothetical protein
MVAAGREPSIANLIYIDWLNLPESEVVRFSKRKKT